MESQIIKVLLYYFVVNVKFNLFTFQQYKEQSIDKSYCSSLAFQLSMYMYDMLNANCNIVYPSYTVILLLDS